MCAKSCTLLQTTYGLTTKSDWYIHKALYWIAYQRQFIINFNESKIHLAFVVIVVKLNIWKEELSKRKYLKGLQMLLNMQSHILWEMSLVYHKVLLVYREGDFFLDSEVRFGLKVFYNVLLWFCLPLYLYLLNL